MSIKIRFIIFEQDEIQYERFDYKTSVQEACNKIAESRDLECKYFTKSTF